MYGHPSHSDVAVQKPQVQEELETQAPEAAPEKSSPGSSFSLPRFAAKVRALGSHLMLATGPCRML